MRLTVVTRRDLSPGQQCAQLMHGALQYAGDRKLDMRDATVICLTVKDRERLTRLQTELFSRSIDYSAYSEVDFGHQITSVSFVDVKCPVEARLFGA
jgi:hypothetical protein